MASRDFLLPDLGEGLEEAEIVSWLVAEGDQVSLNQPLAEVETAKAVVEIPSPYIGRIAKLHGAAGDVIQVGAPLVTFEVEARPDEPAAGPGAGSEPPAPTRQAHLVGYGPKPDEQPSGTVPVAPAKRPGVRVAAAPPVRRLAKELGVDLASVEGTGPGGRVTREDVDKAAASGGPSAPAASASAPPAEAHHVWTEEGDERVPVRGVRRVVAQRMSRSASEIPHVTTFLTVDCTALLAFREEVQSSAGDATRISPLAVVVRALGVVVREHRELNAAWDAAENDVILRAGYHVGIATDTERGLLVAVVRDADREGVSDLATAIAEVVGAAREGTATPEQLTGSTITVSNVGTFGAESGTPIINPPEAAILALGVIEPRALVVDGEVVARPACTLSLSFDHRVMDGAQAGRALAALRDLLQSPDALAALPR